MCAYFYITSQTFFDFEINIALVVDELTKLSATVKDENWSDTSR